METVIIPGSGGWSFPKPGTDDEVIKTLPSVQLYNMQSDPAEKQNNGYAEHSEVVKELKELKDLMIKYVKEGRSTKQLRRRTTDRRFGSS